MAIDERGRGREVVIKRTAPTPDEPLNEDDEPLKRLEAVIQKRRQTYG